mgnify:CR=1 FL=1
MSLEYKIISYNTKALPLLWEENWNLNCIYDWMMFFSREVKKQVKSRALVAESNKSISYLKKQREQIDNWQPIHIPDFVNNESEWIKFVLHWIQKNSEDWKMHCEKQKTFEIKARWMTWISGKEEKTTKSNTIW